MPEMSQKFIPKHKGDKNPNPKLLKFVRHVTDRIPGKIKMDTDAPEYWGLACIFEDEMDAVTREASLDLLLDMLPGNFFRVREHHTYAKLHQMNAEKHYTPDDKSFDDLLDKLAYFGMLEYDYGDKYTKDGPVPGTGFNREDRIYWVPMFVPGSAEYLRADDLPPAGEDHADGAHGRLRHRHARHPGGEGDFHGEPVRRYRAHLLLAQTV